MAADDSELLHELQELQSKYRVMVELAPEPVVVLNVDAGVFVEVNAAACDLFGYSSDALLERSHLSVSPEKQPDGRASVPVAREAIARAVAGEIVELEWQHVDSSGREFPCRVQLHKLPGIHPQLVRGAITDLSATRAAERHAQSLQRMVDEASDLVGIADPQGNMLYMNPAGRRRLEIPDDQDLSEIPILGTYSPASRGRIAKDVLPTVIANGVWRGENEFQTQSGEVFPGSQVVVAHRDERGEIEFLSTVVRDISAAKAAEQFQRRLQLSQKLESLGILAGGVAHDLNNILIGVVGNSAMLIDGLPESGAHREIARDILRAGERAGQLARQMLNYAGQSQPNVTAIDLEAVVRDAAGLLAATVSKKVELRFEFMAEAPAVSGEVAQVRQVMLNLILNASEAFGDREGVIVVSTREASGLHAELVHDFRDPPQEAGLLCEVCDDGPGMTQETLMRVFDPFYSTKFTGRGLGLASVLGIVRAHAGAIGVSSAPGHGTRFQVLLPKSVAEPARSPPARPDAATAVAGGGTVLVIDDEPSVRQVIRRVLARRGHAVLEADDGPEALEAIASLGDQLVAVVLDLTMPKLSGHQVLAKIRETHAQLPVVLMSGYSEESWPAGSRGPHCQFLAKPFTPAELAKALDGASESAASPKG